MNTNTPYLMRRLASIGMILCITTVYAYGQRSREDWPRVHADGRVTFCLEAPEANEVFVRADFEDGPKAMRKDRDGVWTVTLGPAKPDVWVYAIIVDGLEMIDPNHNRIQMAQRLSESLVEVPGEEIQFCMVRDVPHGVVHTHRYLSKSLGVTRQFLVYTPPEYHEKPGKQYPVLYLLHGSGDTEQCWTLLGRADTISDNLLANGKIEPMLIVMPFGHAPHTGAESWRRSLEMSNFEKDLLDDVIPRVEKHYRVKADSKHRALAGLSMGGFQTIETGMKNQDMFAWLGVFSSGIRDGFAESHGDFLQTANDNLALLWVGIGKEEAQELIS